MSAVRRLDHPGDTEERDTMAVADIQALWVEVMPRWEPVIGGDLLMRPGVHPLLLR